MSLCVTVAQYHLKNLREVAGRVGGTECVYVYVKYSCIYYLIFPKYKFVTDYSHVIPL
jgi:hypothetical protein